MPTEGYVIRRRVPTVANRAAWLLIRTMDDGEISIGTFSTRKAALLTAWLLAGFRYSIHEEKSA